MSLIKLEKVSKYYKSNDTVSVGMKNIDLELELGEFVAITGESGSGKSTLLNVLGGLDGYESGEMYLLGEETSHYVMSDWEKYRSSFIGFIFQNYNIIDSYTVLQNILLALEIEGYDPNKRKERALQLIDQVGLTSHKHHRASKLSGGQKQRVAIARALAKDCPIIVADEPTGNLDSETGKKILKLLHDISKNKLVILVTHDFENVEEYATRKIKMHDGEIIEDKKLKPNNEAKLVQNIKPQNMSFLTILRIAFRNFFATPKKFIFMLILQIITATILILVYTSQVANIRETGLMQSDAFPSVPQTRLLIEKRDGSVFSTQEIESLQKMRYVDKVYANGKNFYNNAQLNLLVSHEYYRSVNRLMYTDTAAILSKKNIEGRIPVASDEIVVSSYSNDINIGMKVKVAIDNYNARYENEDLIIGTFTVVGIDKLQRDTIYFSEEFLQSSTLPYTNINYSLYAENLDTMLSNLELITQENNVMFFEGLSYNAKTDVESRYFDDEIEYIETNLNVTFTTTTINEQVIVIEEEVSYYGPKLDPNNKQFFSFRVSNDFYDKLISKLLEASADVYKLDDQNLVSISVKGYGEGSKILKSIDSEKYKVYYPAYIYQPMREIISFLFTLLAIGLLSLIMIFFSFLIQIVTKSVMRSRQIDFTIFRSIGTNKYILARLVVLEQIMLSIFAFIISLIIINLLQANFYIIENNIVYINFLDYIILLIIFILLGIRNGLKFNKKIFHQSVIESLSKSGEDYD